MQHRTSVTTPPLRYAFYVSKARVGLEEVKRIVAAARAANPVKGLSGGMLFTGNYFAQFLEGPPSVLVETMAAIAADARHEAVLELSAGQEAKRQFEAWTMGYISAPQADRFINDIFEQRADERQVNTLRHLLKEWITGGT